MWIVSGNQAPGDSRRALVCLVASTLLFGAVAGELAVSRKVSVVDALTPPIINDHVPLLEFLLMYVMLLGLIAAGFAVSRRVIGFCVFFLASWILLLITMAVFETRSYVGDFFCYYLAWTTVVGTIIARCRSPGNAGWFLAFRVLFISAGPFFFALTPFAIYGSSHYFLGLTLCVLAFVAFGALQRRNRQVIAAHQRKPARLGVR